MPLLATGKGTRNTLRIVEQHLQIRDSDFERAAGGAALKRESGQKGALQQPVQEIAGSRKTCKNPRKTHGFCEESELVAAGCESGQYPRQGLNNPRETLEICKTPVSVAQNQAQISPLDPDLQHLIDAWASLPPVIKSGIVAMIAAARNHAQGEDK